MKTIRHNSNVQQWPKMAQAVNRAAAQLHAQYGEQGIPSDVLQREIERIGGYARHSVIPSDYCYNMVNKAACSFQYLALVQLTHGRYKYVGPAHAYTGLVLWKPKQGNERQVGSWNNGHCELDADPRL